MGRPLIACIGLTLVACAASPPRSLPTSPPATSSLAIATRRDAPGPVVELDPVTGTELTWVSSDGRSDTRLPDGFSLPWSSLAAALGTTTTAPDALRAQRADLDDDGSPETLVQAFRRADDTDDGLAVLAVVSPAGGLTVLERRDTGELDDARWTLLGGAAPAAVFRHDLEMAGLGLFSSELVLCDVGDTGTNLRTTLDLGDVHLAERDEDGTWLEPLVVLAPARVVIVEHTRRRGALDSTLRLIALGEDAPDADVPPPGALFVARHRELADARAHARRLADELDLATLVVPDPDGRHHLVLIGPTDEAPALARRLAPSLSELVVVERGRLTPFFAGLLVHGIDDERHLGTSIRTLEPDTPVEPPPESPIDDTAGRPGLRERRGPR